MEELENTNPTMDNPVNSNEAEVNLENPAPQESASEQGGTDLSKIFSENITEGAPVQNESVSYANPTDLQENQEQPTDISESVNTQNGVNTENVVNSQTEINTQAEVNTESEIQNQEPNFQKELENTSLDNSQNMQVTQETAEQQRAKLEQQKLARLKQHESKAKKSGFASGILSGIILTLLIIAASSIFAKDKVIDAVDYLNSLIPSNNVNNPVIENTEVYENDLSNIEESELIEDEDVSEVDTIQEYYDRVDDIILSENEQENKVEQLTNILNEIIQNNEEPDEELTQYISQKIMDLTINSEDTQNEENNEIQLDENTDEELNNNSASSNVIDEENTKSEDITTDNQINNDVELDETIEENKQPYTITHVNSEEEANWVLPSHCSDLTCYGEDEEFTACTSFRMIETLDENTTRVSNRGGCKYKDPSELVYVEFNN